jgi:hypothetical protein
MFVTHLCWMCCQMQAVYADPFLWTTMFLTRNVA